MQVLFILPGATRLRVCVLGTCVQTIRSQQYVVVVVVVIVVIVVVVVVVVVVVIVVVVIKIVFVTDYFCVLFSLHPLSFQAFLSKMDSPEKIGQTVQIGGIKFSL